MFGKIIQFYKDKPLLTFIIAIVVIAIAVYVYKKYEKKFEHMNSGVAEYGIGASISASLTMIICCVIQILILYYVIKVANKNAIIETSSGKS